MFEDNLGGAGGGGAPAAIPTTPSVPASHTAEIPSTPAPISSPAAIPDFSTHIAEYKDKPWAQDLVKSEKPWEAMVKGYAGAQELIGKKSSGLELPGEGATAEQISAWNKAIGVPETPAGYEYKAPDITKEPEAVQKALTERAANTAFIDSMRAEAHKAGITPKQFNALAAVFDGQTISQVKASIEAQTVAQTKYADAEMKLFKETYGDKANVVKDIVKETLAKVVPQNIRDAKNPNLALVTAAMFIHEKLFKNDTIGGANLGAPGLSKEAIRAEISKLRADPGFRDQFARNHKAINEKVDALYNQMLEKAPE